MPAESSNVQGTVYIALPAHREDYAAVGGILADTLRRLGYRAAVVRDGDPAVLEADVVILYGHGAGFAAYRKFFSTRADRRPVTALWLVEPLPPPGLSEEARHMGLRLAGCDWNRLPRPLAALAKALPLSSTARGFARGLLADRLRREMPPAYRPIHGHALFRVMDGYAWFKTRYSASWCDFVFASTAPRCEFLGEMGIEGHHVSLGYHPTFGEDLATPRDIDALFLGRVRKTSRQEKLDILTRALAGRGIDLVVVEKACHGRERTALLNRARIVVDLAQIPWEMIVQRHLICMSCGALIVSDFTGDPAPFSKDHLIQIPFEGMVEAIAHYLDHEDQRQRIARAGHRFVTTELTMERAISRLLATARVSTSGTSDRPLPGPS